MMVLPAPGSSASRKRMRGLQEIVVDGFELVRQRVNPRDRQRKVGIVLVGEPEPHLPRCRGEAKASPSNGSMSGVVSGLQRTGLV